MLGLKCFKYIGFEGCQIRTISRPGAPIFLGMALTITGQLLPCEAPRYRKSRYKKRDRSGGGGNLARHPNLPLNNGRRNRKLVKKHIAKFRDINTALTCSSIADVIYFK